MDVSLGCSLLSRQERLTPVFLHLLKDDSRWVREGGREGEEGGVNAWLIDYEK